MNESVPITIIKHSPNSQWNPYEKYSCIYKHDKKSVMYYHNVDHFIETYISNEELSKIQVESLDKVQKILECKYSTLHIKCIYEQVINKVGKIIPKVFFTRSLSMGKSQK